MEIKKEKKLNKNNFDLLLLKTTEVSVEILPVCHSRTKFSKYNNSIEYCNNKHCNIRKTCGFVKPMKIIIRKKIGDLNETV